LSDNLASYSVVKGPGGTTSITVTSAFFLDSTSYGDSASIGAVTYKITANRSANITSPTGTVDVAVITPDKNLVDANTVCMVSGNVKTVAGLAAGRTLLRVEPYKSRYKVHPLYNVADVTARSNLNGDFSIPAIRGSVIKFTIPDADYHIRVAIPDQATASLADLELVKIDPYTNN
jgi:hypothetical protein